MLLQSVSILDRVGALLAFDRINDRAAQKIFTGHANSASEVFEKHRSAGNATR
jgi:hypothetical protein